MIDQLPDMMTVAQSVSDHMILAEDINIDTTQIGSDVPKLNIVFSNEIKKIFRIIGVLLLVAWTAMIIWKNAKPESRGQQGQGGNLFAKVGGFGTVIVAVACIVSIVNPDYFILFVNLMLKLGWIVMGFIKSAFGND